MKKKNGTIIRAYQKTFGEKEIKTLKNDDLSVFLNTLNRLVSDTAMLVIADTEKNIKISSKNDSLIRSSEIYDLIMLDYTGNKLITKEPGGFIVRYYSSSKNENQVSFPTSISVVSVSSFRTSSFVNLIQSHW